MGTLRGYEEEDISDSSGEVEVWAANSPSPGMQVELGMFRLRMKTSTPQDPYLGGQVLAVVRWHDGNGEQSWPVALATYDGNYTEQAPPGGDLWVDGVRAVTIEITPFVAGGTADVLLIYKER